MNVPTESVDEGEHCMWENTLTSMVEALWLKRVHIYALLEILCNNLHVQVEYACKRVRKNWVQGNVQYFDFESYATTSIMIFYRVNQQVQNDHDEPIRKII